MQLRYADAWLTTINGGVPFLSTADMTSATQSLGNYQFYDALNNMSFPNIMVAMTDAVLADATGGTGNAPSYALNTLPIYTPEVGGATDNLGVNYGV
jgi:hypothetical protein